MGITKILVANDFRMFKDGLAADTCSGTNIFIGNNGTGKTTLLKGMYAFVNLGLPLNGIIGIFDQILDSAPSVFQSRRVIKEYIESTKDSKDAEHSTSHEEITSAIHQLSEGRQHVHGIYIPEKDILEHAKGLLTFVDQKQTGFSEIYKAVLVAAQDVPTKEQTEMQKSIGEQIAKIIGGYIEWDQGDGSYYTVKTDGNRIPFANEASGYKKLGYLGLLVASGQLNPNSILFWDEPENSLSSDIYPTLVKILLELTKSGIQIFIATHDHNLVRYFDIRKDKSIPVQFHNLTKAKEGGIICHSSDKYLKLPDNHMEKAEEDFYEAVIADAMGVQKNGENT